MALNGRQPTFLDSLHDSRIAHWGHEPVVGCNGGFPTGDRLADWKVGDTGATVHGEEWETCARLLAAFHEPALERCNRLPLSPLEGGEG